MSFIVEIESRQKISRVKQAKLFYKSQSDRVITKNISGGDFVFDNLVSFKYYSLVDFVRFVKNKSLFKVAKLQSNIFEYHFIILVSTFKQREEYFNKLKYSGQKYMYFDNRYYYEAISNLNTVTTVIEVPNDDLAFQVMRIQAKKCLDNNNVIREFYD